MHSLGRSPLAEDDQQDDGPRPVRRVVTVPISGASPSPWYARRHALVRLTAAA